MKLRITEQQYRLLVESEEENLIDFSKHRSTDPDLWDEIFEQKNKLTIRKGGKKYDGYYINGNVNLSKSNIIELKYLVRINGNLIGRESVIEDLGMLKKVVGNVNLSSTKNLKSLGNLEYVKFDLDLKNSNIEDLGHLNEVGRSLDLRFTPELKSLGKVSPSFPNDKFKIHVTDFLMTHRTGLSDEQIDKIKYNWLSKSPYGN